jgi:hypothetical protein
VKKGEILTAIDLCTREMLMWWLPDRSQKRVANALYLQSQTVLMLGYRVALHPGTFPACFSGGCSAGHFFSSPDFVVEQPQQTASLAAGNVGLCLIKSCTTRLHDQAENSR